MANKYKGGKKVSKGSAKQTVKKVGLKYSPIKTDTEKTNERARQARKRRRAAMSQNKVGSKSQKRKYFNNTYEVGK